MKTILLTGFEPFAGGKVNPSQLVAQHFAGRVIRRHQIVGRTLPCEFGGALRQLKKLLRLHQPALVICLGQAGGRAEITPERVAINLQDARIADNAGQQPLDQPVVRGGPVAYWSTLPVKAIVAAQLAHHLPAAVSQTAGTFVCNYLFYGLMHELARQPKGVRGGFIHLPFLPEQTTNQPSLPLGRMIDGIQLAMEISLSRRRDSKQPGGATH